VDSAASKPSTRLVRALDVDPDPPKSKPTPEALQASKELLRRLSSSDKALGLVAATAAVADKPTPSARLVRALDVDPDPPKSKPAPEALQASKALLAKLAAPPPQELVPPPAKVCACALLGPAWSPARPPCAAAAAAA
jgi:hypothetical protein